MNLFWVNCLFLYEIDFSFFVRMFILLTIKDVIRIEPSKFSEEHVTVSLFLVFV